MALTPLMQQYWQIKSQHEDQILLFRMGDFFEMFHDDAKIAAPLLGIALTQRNRKAEDDTPMCGVPHHSIAGPVAKLLAAGYRVAICDQIEDPKFAKGLVERAVTRVLTPGMVYDPETLDQLEANYMAAFDGRNLAFFEASTGEAFYYTYGEASERQRIFALLRPCEVIVSAEQKAQYFHHFQALTLSIHEIQNKNLVDEFKSAPEAVQRLVSYAVAMQGREIVANVKSFEPRRLEQTMVLSANVTRHLELFETYKRERQGSLFHAINRTKTAAGARLLKSWMKFPLTQVESIEQRLDRVQFWVEKVGLLKDVRHILAQMGDIERRLAKLNQPHCSGRDLIALGQSLQAGLSASQLCDWDLFERQSLQVASTFVEEIQQKIEEDAPAQLKNGGVIRKGVVSTLDELIQLSDDSQELLLAMQERERAQTGIASLKIAYNNVFGYYIEVTKTHISKVPSGYQRKQTLANAERYVTSELQELEEKILSARVKRIQLELEIFDDLRRRLLAAGPDLLGLVRRWSELDVASSLAWLALEHGYRRPSFSKPGALQLEGSRHPVVEQQVAKPFVPNDIRLGPGDCLLLTGPNMAGKSTLMRQVAVTGILAQMGSFVPAKTAILPLFHHVFTRIGASDFLAEGLSTFMVEMKETAEMVSSADAHSLVLLDEIGRGTSTYDGMSLAQAILEYLVQKSGAMTLFATHYHELTDLAKSLSAIKNYHMAIDERNGDIEFLHTLVSGPANKSYGIHVARLAGLPATITSRATELLKGFEQDVKWQQSLF